MIDLLPLLAAEIERQKDFTQEDRIELVAIAMCRFNNGGVSSGWDKRNTSAKQHYRNLARVAVEAAAPPTLDLLTMAMGEIERLRATVQRVNSLALKASGMHVAIYSGDVLAALAHGDGQDDIASRDHSHAGGVKLEGGES